MAQTTILAAGDTAADSTNVTVVSGASITLSLWSTGVIPQSTSMRIMMHTPTATVTQVGSLSYSNQTVSIYSPGVYYVERTARSNPGVDVGVSVDQ